MRYYLSYLFFETDTSDDIMADVNHIISLDSFKEENPLYWKTFEAFWQEVSVYWQLTNSRSHRKLSALLLCIALCPLEEVVPIIHIYISTDISFLFTNYLQQVITNHYRGQYQFHFEKDYTKAELILCTAPFDQLLLTDKQQYLVIRSHMGANDFELLDQTLSNLPSSDKSR